MAVVTIHQIKSTPAKALAYISRPDATNQGLWVSSNAYGVIDASDYTAVAKQFQRTVVAVGVTSPREGSVLAHHIIQSFDPKDGIDASTAHRIGEKLAQQFTNDEYEYLLATHLDKGHVHNHLIVNTVSRVTGRRIRIQRSTLKHLRELSDELCRQEGLRVLPPATRPTGKSMADIYLSLNGESAKQIIRIEIDKATQVATTWREFEALLRQQGIEVSTRSKSVSFRHAAMKRPVRDFRLGLAYTEDAIMARLTRKVSNQILIDASLIESETESAIRFRVPKTRGRLYMSVSKSQIVRHGRLLRVYVATDTKALLSNRAGRFQKAVGSDDLYQWFSTPDIAVGIPGARGGANQWNRSIVALHEMEQRINAKARWLSNGSSARDALNEAQKFIVETRSAYHHALVALAELQTDNAGSSYEIDQLNAYLRSLERKVETTREDIKGLTDLSRSETSASVSQVLSDHIATARTTHRTVESQQERRRYLAQQSDERQSDLLAEDDARQDREVGNRSMSLLDRINLQKRTLHSQEADGRKPRDRKRNR